MVLAAEKCPKNDARFFSSVFTIDNQYLSINAYSTTLSNVARAVESE
jgi:hypothetical protein